MKLRLAGVGAAIGLLSVLAPADAGTLVIVKDATGDATGLDQGLGCIESPACLPRDVAGPWSQPGFDIVSLTYGSTFTGKTPKDLVVTLTYAAKPDETSTVHRVTAEDAGGCSTFMIQYYAEPKNGKSSALRTCDESTTLGYADVPLALPKVEGNNLVWTIPYSILKGLKSPLKPGSVISGLGAHNRTVTAATFPVIDNVLSELSYKLGS